MRYRGVIIVKGKLLAQGYYIQSWVMDGVLKLGPVAIEGNRQTQISHLMNYILSTVNIWNHFHLVLSPSTSHYIRVCNIMSSADTPDHDALITELSNLTSIPPQEVCLLLLHGYSLATTFRTNPVPRPSSISRQISGTFPVQLLNTIPHLRISQIRKRLQKLTSTHKTHE